MLSDLNTTNQQVLQLTGKSNDLYKYLASNMTKRILEPNEMISTLHEERFLLVRENETCLVSIKTSDNTKRQRFTLFASIMNIRQEYQLDNSQHLVYHDDFIPSIDTQLKSLQDKSPIELVLVDHNLPITIIVQNTETNEQMKFNSSLSITTDRICTFACQLFDLNKEHCQLKLEDSTNIDEDFKLDELDENAIEFHFQLTSTVTMNCSIKFVDDIVVLPCEPANLLLTLVKEALNKFQIPFDQLDDYELVALDDDRTQIDWETSVDEIRTLFSDTMTTIPLELKKKDE